MLALRNSPLSPITKVLCFIVLGDVGRERPCAMGACVRGVFWGVGAVGSTWLMGMLTDIVAGERARRVRVGGGQGQGREVEN